MFQRGAEAVGVLHEEFAGPEDSESGPFFVAEFGLDLVEGDGHLAVAADVPRHEVGDDFFVSRAEGEVEFSVTAACFEVEQDVSEGFAASCAFKDFDGLESGHEQFDGSGAIHFLSDDFGDFTDGSIAEWQPGIAPAISWRIMPARSISWWLGTSASAGTSFMVGMNVWDQRIGRPEQTGRGKTVNHCQSSHLSSISEDSQTNCHV